jgi:hypothetical protein
MGTNGLESVMLIFTLDFREFDKILALYYYLNWLRTRRSRWECNGDSGGYEHQRGEHLSSLEEHCGEGKQKLWLLNYIVEMKERVVGLANERNDNKRLRRILRLRSKNEDTFRRNRKCEEESTFNGRYMAFCLSCQVGSDILSTTI